MKSVLFAFLTMGLCFGNVGWSAPSIQSIDVSPNPLLTGQSFSITVSASLDVTQAVARVDFRPGEPRSLQVLLTRQGLVWTGSGVIPTDLGRQLPGNAGAMVKVAVFDAAHGRAEGLVQVGVEIVSISANFAGGNLTVTGDDHDNTLIVSRDAAGTIFVNGGTVPVTGDIPTVANTSLIRILGLGGNDVLTVDDVNGPMPPANLLGGDGDDTLTGTASDDELDGGPGNDTLRGRGGIDRLLGGPGNDTLIGGTGADLLFGGAGDDQIVWNPGDGSDLVEGEDGNDTLDFFGANINEIVDISANGPRLRFVRNIASITMDCDGVERVIFHALGGADQVNVNDLMGTQVTQVVVDLNSTAGTGDALADTVMVNATETNDVITVTGSTNGVTVLGLAAAVTVVGGEPGLDELVINARGGTDIIDASAVQPGAIDLILNGGPGNDTLIGGDGSDLLIGGQGTDTMLGGPGDDTFLWNPGDGSDLVEGETGQDTLLFNGANIAETIDLSANGQRLRFSRNIANITMDCDGIELVQFNALGGPDLITINDLSATAVRRVNLDLASPASSGLGDNEADTVIVNGTDGDDLIVVAGTSAGITVQGLAATVSIVASEAARDELRIKALAGNDVVRATELQAGVIALTADGGPDDDILIGSPGPDTLLGGEGDDVLEGGAGLDVLDGGPGNNIVIQD